MYSLAETIVALIVVFLIAKWALKSTIEEIKNTVSVTIYLFKHINKKDFIEAKNKICNLYNLYKMKKIQEKNKK